MAKVYDRLDKDNGSWGWRGAIRDGRSKEEQDQLLNTVADCALSDKEDVWECLDGPNRKFTVGWMRKRIADKYQETKGKTRWCRWVPKKIRIFIWRLSRNRLPVKDNLERKGIQVNSRRCEMCKEEDETAMHTFHDCMIIKELWSKVKMWWSIQPPVPTCLEDLVEKMEIQAKSKTEKQLLFVVCAATLNQIWKNRNEAQFHNKGIQVNDMFLNVQKESALWIESRAYKVELEKLLWVNSPRLAVKTM
ncbi:hypothetical protein LXL04_039915 [Taraxacum kok-saghyz]